MAVKKHDDKIMVAENYCLACEGECSNDDPEDFNHLYAEFDALAGAWMDRGASPAAIWAFMASVLIDISIENDMDRDEMFEHMKKAWDLRDKEEA